MDQLLISIVLNMLISDYEDLLQLLSNDKERWGGLIDDINKKVEHDLSHQQKPTQIFTFAVTGVHHGSLVEAESEAQARDIFSKCWGEEILHVKKKGSGPALMYS